MHERQIGVIWQKQLSLSVGQGPRFGRWRADR